MKYLLICFLCNIYLTTLSANEISKEKIELYSEHIGYTHYMENQFINDCYDLEAYIQGFKNYEANIKPKSILSHDESLEWMLKIKSDILEEEASENLIQAEKFLSDISKNSDCKEVVEKKLYIQILKEGSGTKEVTLDSIPFFRYRVFTINGLEENAWDHKDPSPICLDKTIPGFEKGTIGMKQGEQRKLYIHPDLAYKKTGLFPPNSLMIFEVEVVQVG